MILSYNTLLNLRAEGCGESLYVGSLYVGCCVGCMDGCLVGWVVGCWVGSIHTNGARDCGRLRNEKAQV